jgi:hypothetical protein
MAIDVFVGRPRILVITGAETPNALPSEVFASAVIAAAPNNERREMGFLAQLFNRYLLSWLIGEK